MIKNYILTAVRNILRKRIFSIINLCGLSVGIASVILILLWVRDELSYDSFHENRDRIFRIITKFTNDGGNIWTTSPFPLGAISPTGFLMLILIQGTGIEVHS